MSNTAWQHVLLARHPKRPTSRILINTLFDDFIELKGDRQYRDDASIIGGLATLNGIPVTIIAEEKGSTTNDKILHNFGMPHPEGYRKALRLMKQAEKFKRPIVTIIDTPGAYPGIGAEERGQAQAIALNLQEMMGLKVPIMVVVLSEGGSGGALAIGVGDHVMMFEHAIYSILSPEGFATILFKDAKQAEHAASLMKLTANDLLQFNVIDEIIPEGSGLHETKEGLFNLKSALSRNLTQLLQDRISITMQKRYQKYRQMGVFLEGVTSESTQH